MNNDLISRSELKKALCDFMENNIGIYSNEMFHIVDSMPTVEERPQGEYVDISKLRLMTVEECAGHTIEYAMGWKACIEWIKKGGAEE